MYIDPVFNPCCDARARSCGPIYRHVIFSHGRVVVFSYGHDDGICVRDHHGDGIRVRDHIFHMYDDRRLMVSLDRYPAPVFVVPGSLLQCQALLLLMVLLTSTYNCCRPIW